jgi:hypothetical protein
MNGADRSILRWGGIASTILPVFYAILGIALVLDPAEQYRDERYWTTLAQQPMFTYTWRFAFFMIGILALAVIPAVVRLVRSPDGAGEGFLRWITLLAVIGSASLAIDCMRGLFLTKDYIIEAYTSGNAVMQMASKAALAGGTDVNGVFQYGFVGVWYFAIGLLALRNAKLPKPLAYIALATGIDYVITLFFGLTDWFIPGTHIAIMALTALIGGVVIAPIFHFWLGILLLRQTATPAVPAQMVPANV